MIDQFRQTEESLLVLDAGGIVDPFAAKAAEKAKTCLLAMHVMGYDAANLGENDFKHILPLLEEHPELQLPFLTTALRNSQQDNQMTFNSLVLDVDGIAVGIIGLSPLTDFGMKYDLHGPFASVGLTKALPPVLAALEPKADIIVALSQYGREDTRRIMEQFPDIDVIISGGERHDKNYALEYVDGRPLAWAYRKGEQLGVLRLEVDPSGGIIDARNEMIPLGDSIPDHPEVRRVIEDNFSSPKSRGKKASTPKNKDAGSYDTEELLKLTPEEFLEQWKKMDQGQ